MPVSWATTLKWQDEQREAWSKRMWKEKSQTIVSNPHPTYAELCQGLTKCSEYVDDLWKLIHSYRFKISELEHPEYYKTHA